jgi:hypothetical protein
MQSPLEWLRLAEPGVFPVYGPESWGLRHLSFFLCLAVAQIKYWVLDICHDSLCVAAARLESWVWVTQVVEVKMDTAHPRLHQIFEVCKAVKGWLQLSDRNVAVIHCSNGRSR